MIVNQAALKRQITVVVLMILIIIAGTYSYVSLPRESDPDITIPYIFVTTHYEGVAPEDMEKLVTVPLERKLKGLSDVEEMTSISDDGLSRVVIEFVPSVDIDDALQKVRDKVDQAKSDLPQDLENDPVITEVNFSEVPVVEVVLTGPYSLKRLKTHAETFQDKFESIHGVLEAEIIGGLDREIHVEVDLDRLNRYKIPFSNILTAVQTGNVNVPGGSMDIGDAKYQVRVPEEYEHPSEINSIVAFVQNGRPIYLRDIAVVRDHYKDPTTKSRLGGQPAVTISVVKRSGENIIYMVDEVKQVIEKMKPGLPPNLHISLINDMSEDVRRMVSDLENNILTGLVLVLGVVFLFIGGRSALFVSLAIPFSMLITFTLLSALNITLNMVVLFSLTLALGMLVDNGIVIVENIYRHMQEGKTRMQAARDATDEVAWPVITSTLTTVGAFFPVLFWPGIMGEFMVYLPKTVIIALAASLFVALVINPVLSARYQSIKTGDRNKSDSDVDLDNLPVMKRFYKGFLSWSLNHRLLIVSASFLFLIASIAGFTMFGAGMEFMPDIEPQYADVHLKAPVGTNLEASDRLVKEVETIVDQYPDVRHMISKVGSESKGAHVSEVTLEFVDLHERSQPSSQTILDLRERLAEAVKGAEIRVEEAQDGPPTGSPINLEIYGEDIEVLGKLVGEVRDRIKNVSGLVDLKDDFVDSKPELKVKVDKEKAALLGINAMTIAQTVKSAINGSKVGVFREGKDEYDIVARLPQKDRQSVESLRRLTVSGATGEPVPLTSLAKVMLSRGYGGINHIDQKRVVTVSADVTGRTANEIIAQLNGILGAMAWPRDYSYQFTGEREEQDKSMAFLSKAFIGAVFIIFLVLVTQFNSALTPFIILASVLLSLIGVFLGLLITGKPFGVIMTGVGVISLAGVVVNNAIVLIDYYNQLRARGLKVQTALLQTGLVRFRPVMLTAITTILGLLPMATQISFDFFHLRFDVGGESSQWWSSMATAVIFGLTVSTLLTLIVVPVLCSLAESIRGTETTDGKQKATQKGRKWQASPPVPTTLQPARVATRPGRKTS